MGLCISIYLDTGWVVVGLDKCHHNHHYQQSNNITKTQSVSSKKEANTESKIKRKREYW